MKTRKIISILLALLLVVSLFPAAVFAADGAGLTVSTTMTGNTGAVIVASGAVTAKTDSEFVTLSTVGNTVTVTAAAGAVGVAEIEVSNGSETVNVEVPVGYTTFYFNGDQVTIYKGSSENYEVTGINAADEEYAPEATLDANGNEVYANTAAYTIVIDVKKKGGEFVLTGKSANMGVAVKKESTGPSVLMLAGVDLACSFTSPITIKKDSTTTATITAMAGWKNILSDTAANNADTNADNLLAESAVIKAKTKGDLTINGNGVLDIVCKSKNAVKTGVSGKLTVEDVTLNIVSDKNGLSADNLIELRSGTFNINCAGDAIRTDPDAVDAAAGTAAIITISGGTYDLVTGGDAIRSMQDVTISGGTFSIKTASGAQIASTSSAKGIKASASDDDSADSSTATNTITITGGTFDLDCADDAIHSDAYINILGGKFVINSNDDALHADTILTIGAAGDENNKINLTVESSFEALEAGTVNIYSGIIDVTAADDGVNAGGGQDSSGFRPGGGGSGMGGFNPSRPGHGGSSSTAATFSINIYGGIISVNGGGDGFDSNGALNLTGGSIIVWDRGANAQEWALDCDGSLNIKGATVFAAGSSRMVTRPASGSQPYIGTSVSAAKDKTINVKYNGTTVFNIKAIKAVNYVLYSSPEMTSSTGWSIVIDDSPVIVEEEDPCANGHSWGEGTVKTAATCLTAGVMHYVCSECGAEKDEPIPATGHHYANGYCSGCGEEDPNAVWYVVSYACDAHSTITAYDTQDVTGAGTPNAASALVRDGDTGKKDISGDGQANFKVVPAEGYHIASVEVTEGTANYKNLKEVDLVNGIYRVTKITGNLTITVTTAKNEEVCAHNYVNGYCAICGEEDPNAAWYVVSFACDANSSVTAYDTQDVTGAGTPNAASAIVRNGDTGKKDLSGEGQANFKVVPAAGYRIASVEVTEGAGNYKNLKEVDAENGIYRLTKVTGSLTVTVKTEPDAPAFVSSAVADKAAYAVDETITVTVDTDRAAEKVYLTNENGGGLASTRACKNNGDGTYTWTLTLSLGTIGSRTLSVYADGEALGLSVSFDVTYPQAAGEPVIRSISLPLNIYANEAFTATIVTNQYAEAVRFFNESGAGLMPSSCTYVDEGDARIWSYTIAVGTAGNRTFAVKAAASDFVYVGSAQAMIVVK